MLSVTLIASHVLPPHALAQGVWARPTKPFEVQTTVASIKLEYAGDVAANNVTMDSPFT